MFSFVQNWFAQPARAVVLCTIITRVGCRFSSAYIGRGYGGPGCPIIDRQRSRCGMELNSNIVRRLSDRQAAPGMP